MHVVPDEERIEAPQGQLLQVPLDFPGRSVVVEIVEVRGEVNAANRLPRHRFAPPRARRKPRLRIPAGPQQLAQPVEHAQFILPSHIEAAAGRIPGPESLPSDARIQRERHGPWRFPGSQHPGRAAAFHLPSKDGGRLLQRGIPLHGQHNTNSFSGHRPVRLRRQE